MTRLAVDRDTCMAMGERAAVSAQQYSIAATAARFGKLVSGEFAPEAVAGLTGPEQGVRPDNPFQFDYTKIFCDHPSSFWDNETFSLTKRGEDLLKRTVDVPLPQLALLSGAVSPEQVENFLRHVKQGRTARQCINAGVEPVIFSVALKNGLVSIK